MKDVLPKECDWIKAKVTNFDPDNNTVVTSDGQKVILRLFFNDMYVTYAKLWKEIIDKHCFSVLLTRLASQL